MQSKTTDNYRPHHKHMNLCSVGLLCPSFFRVNCFSGVIVERFEMQLPQLCSQHDQILERYAAVYRVCEGTGDILQVHWQLGQDACSEISREWALFCTRGNTAEMIEYQRGSSHSPVIGVLSTTQMLHWQWIQPTFHSVSLI